MVHLAGLRCLVESKELGWYLDGLDNKLVVWVVSMWFGVVLG